MEAFKKGDAVFHEVYGKGTVNATRVGGWEVRVSFGAFSLWLTVTELARTEGGLRLIDDMAPVEAPAKIRTSFDAIMRLLNGQESAQDLKMLADSDRRDSGGSTARVDGISAIAKKNRSRPTPQYRPTPKDRDPKDVSAIEAFRLGIVPMKHIRHWTVGREQETRQILEFLKNEAEGAVLIEGAYGAGKSHLLQFLAQSAEEAGYAVAMAGFDPSEASAAFPKKAYRNLLREFTALVGGRRLTLRGFLEEVAAASGWREVLGDHWVFGAFLDKVEKDKVKDDDWDWIAGRGQNHPSRPSLLDYSTCANMYCNLLSAISRAATEVLGLTGLVILLDEAEVAGNVMYKYQAVRGINLFRGLVYTANDDPVLVEEEHKRQNDIVVGTVSKLIYSAHNPVAYTTGIPSNLKVAFALTPGSLQDEFRKVRDSIVTIELDVLSMNQLNELFHRICDTFALSYGINLVTKERDRLFRMIYTADRVTSTRTFIKAAVEALDYLRFFPKGDVELMVLGGGHGE